MPSRKHRPEPEDPVEVVIRQAGSIGALERLAGIPQDHDSRFAFWRAFSQIKDSRESLDAGVAELRRRIRARPRSSILKAAP